MKAIVFLFHTSEAEIAETLDRELVGCHVYDLRSQFFHPPSNLDLIFKRDSTVLVNIRIWAEREPPFRHCVIVAELLFAKGVCVSLGSVRRVEFGV
jgi:hypothetical protein